MVEQGHRRQEAGSSRSGAMLWALAGRRVVSQQCEAREAGVESPLQHTVVLGGYKWCRHVRRRKPAVPIGASIM